MLIIQSIFCRTAKGHPPVTFAVAACETQNVNVTVLPCFGLAQGSNVTAKDMWGLMSQVLLVNNYVVIQYFGCFRLLFYRLVV